MTSSANTSMTVHRKCGCGTVHLTLEYNAEFKPTRVGVTLGKAGGCASAQLQALQNSLNERLANEEDITYIYNKTRDGKPTDNSWIGIRCPNIQREEEDWHVEEEDDKHNLSCPDVIAKILRYSLGKLEEWKTKKK